MDPGPLIPPHAEPSDPQDAEVANMYLSNYERFASTARFWTESYAMPRAEVTGTEVSHLILSYRILFYRILSYLIFSICNALYGSELNCAVLLRSALYCAWLCRTTLRCIILYYIILRFTMLYCVVPHCVVTYCTVSAPSLQLNRDSEPCQIGTLRDPPVTALSSPLYSSIMLSPPLIAIK